MTARDVAKAPFWSRLAYRYIETLELSQIDFCLASTSPVDMGGDSIWARWGDRFLRMPPERYVNVVCENAQAAEHLWTAGVPNLVIAAVEHEGQALSWQSYLKYDVRITPSGVQQLALERVGVLSLIAKPMSADLESALGLVSDRYDMRFAKEI